MSKINTNMAAVTALYHLKNKEDAQNQAIERISSGLRLNHALMMQQAHPLLVE